MKTPKGKYYPEVHFRHSFLYWQHLKACYPMWLTPQLLLKEKQENVFLMSSTARSEQAKYIFLIMVFDFETWSSSDIARNQLKTDDIIFTVMPKAVISLDLRVLGLAVSLLTKSCDHENGSCEDGNHQIALPAESVSSPGAEVGSAHKPDNERSRGRTCRRESLPKEYREPACVSWTLLLEAVSLHRPAQQRWIS